MNRKRYVKAMLKAIDKARVSVWVGGRTYSKTFGLRVIKRFQKVNKTMFDPFNKYHVDLITGHAEYEHLFWKAKRLNKLD